MKNEVHIIDNNLVSIKDKANEIPDGVSSIQAPEFWNKGYYGQGITIAVLDTGCQTNHPDLKGRIIGGKNFTNEDFGQSNIYEDYNGHGTHVAGIIAANKNDTGIAGVAPKANLLILKVLDKNGTGTYKAITKAIKYAISKKVDIITMSLGGSSPNSALHSSIKSAVQNEIAVVCAASNEGDGNYKTDEYAYPAYYTEVISVGALTESKTVATFSNSNNQIDLIAPGVNIMSTYNNGLYAIMSGTSMAAPHVAGALALLINYGLDVYGRRLTELELYSQLVRRAVSLGNPKSLEGNGMLYLTAQELLEQLIKNK